MRGNKLLARAVSALAITSICVAPVMAKPGPDNPETTTPIQHVVVIFQENVSFDHYFATYPNAANTDGPEFTPADGTPTVNGLGTLVNGLPSGVLLTNNPNFLNGSNTPPANPFRLENSQASTCDQDHAYGDEQASFDMGLMDLFPLHVGAGTCGGFDYGHGKGLVMGYFDGNTVTALWNYAQNYAMSDNFFGTTFGPSTPGALNVVAGNTYPVTPTIPSGGTLSTNVFKNVDGKYTDVGDLDPTGDACSSKTANTIRQNGKNIGDLLNAAGLSWGSFMGGFDLTVFNPNGSTGCSRNSPDSPAEGPTTNDYIPHHAWFQYFASTANPMHTRPSVPPSEYGSSADTGANHEYDTHDFFDALNAGNLPAVSYLKAPADMDGHAGYSDPLREQEFVVNVINALQKSDFWDSTAIFVTWDDSDGWYDHQMNPIVNSSAETTGNPATTDQLNGSGKCGNGTPLEDNGSYSGGNVIQGRCGYGPRIPMLAISPYSKQNFVDHGLSDQSSIPRFIEDNWNLGRLGGGSFDALAGPLDNMLDFTQKVNPGHRNQLFLDPSTGEVTGGHK